MLLKRKKKGIEETGKEREFFSDVVLLHRLLTCNCHICIKSTTIIRVKVLPLL